MNWKVGQEVFVVWDRHRGPERRAMITEHDALRKERER